MQNGWMNLEADLNPKKQTKGKFVTFWMIWVQFVIFKN